MIMTFAFSLALILAGDPSAAVTTPVAAAPAAPAASDRPARLALGEEAPATSREMMGVNGKAVSLDSVTGEKGLMVMFTCNHCPYVKAWQSRMVELAKAAREKKIGVIFVNSNDPAIVDGDSMEGMKALAKEAKYRFPYVQDTGAVLARAFGATRTPEVFLFDADGKLAYHGAVDDSSQDAEAVTKTFLADAIRAVAAGEAVDVAETKAIGCTIKFPKA